MVKDAELIFYGIDNVKTMDTVYITEGKWTHYLFMNLVFTLCVAYRMEQTW